MMGTGAVVAGRGTFEPAGGWGGDHHDGVPIFILSRREPGIDTGQWPLVTYVDDVRTAMTEAKRAAGDKNVLVHGAATAQLALAAGVLDELEIHLVPVLFGQGRRLFDNLDPEQIELERTRVLEGEAASPTCTTASDGRRRAQDADRLASSWTSVYSFGAPTERTRHAPEDHPQPVVRHRGRGRGELLHLRVQELAHRQRRPLPGGRPR